jgi:hypothetical protein
MATHRNSIEAPKWASFGTAVRQIANQCNLDIQVNKESGVIRETIFYRVDGEQEAINKFKRMVNETVADYNS